MAKVLFCVPYHSAFTGPVSRALISQGHEVQIYDYQKGNMLTRILRISTNKLSWIRKKIEPLILQTRQDTLLAIVKSWNPNIVLVIKGESILPDTLLQIKKRGVYTVNWYPDWLVLWDWIKVNAPAYSLFASSCFDTHKKLKKEGISTIYLPYAAEPDMNFYSGSRPYDISFVGQYSDRRAHFFEAIRDLGLHIWGYNLWKKSNLKDIVKPPVSVKETLGIFRKSKIVVNILTGSDTFQPNTVNVRTFETLGTGSLLMVHNHPLLEKHFNTKKEMVVFNDVIELRKKIKFYLTHESKRQKIAFAGWERVKSDHTYTHRLKQLFTYIKKNE